MRARRIVGCFVFGILLAGAACSGDMTVGRSDAGTPGGGYGNDPYNSSGTCGPSTCFGCCINNVCHDGTTPQACGAGGSLCTVCGEGAGCSQGGCVPGQGGAFPDAGSGSGGSGSDSGSSSGSGSGGSGSGSGSGSSGSGSGGCVPKCASRCAGGDDGCGGKCPTTNCSFGCCTADHKCYSGTANNNCGTGGVSCIDCAASSMFCIQKACVANCTPKCTNKCQGQADGCGGTCPTNTCTGCCSSSGTGKYCQTGTAASNCGTGGKACVPCSKFEPNATCNASTHTCVFPN